MFLFPDIAKTFIFLYAFALQESMPRPLEGVAVSMLITMRKMKAHSSLLIHRKFKSQSIPVGDACSNRYDDTVACAQNQTWPCGHSSRHWLHSLLLNFITLFSNTEFKLPENQSHLPRTKILFMHITLKMIRCWHEKRKNIFVKPHFIRQIGI